MELISELKMLTNCKTLETFEVFKVSNTIFADDYERKNKGKGNRYVLKPWF